jgi:hypothetical protein
MNQPASHQTKPADKAPDLLAQDPMLAACRDLAVKMLTESLDGFFARLEETYFELADKSFDRKLRDDYFAARVETHNKRAMLSAQFKHFFSEAFNKSLQNPSGENDQKFFYVNADLDQLSLVANDEYEENLSADKVVKSIKQNGGEELNQLELRFARLLARGDENQVTNNPMSPEAICEAFLQACKQLETGVDARLVAMQAFEDELSSQVADVYHQVNQYLITQNVQPLGRTQRISRKNSPVPAGASSGGQAGESSPNANASAEGFGAPASQQGFNHSAADHYPQQLGAHLANLAGRVRSNVAAPAIAAEHAPGWLAFLDVLQRKAPPSDELSDEQGVPLTHNLLGVLRDSGWAKQLPQLDAMTLELVAMLFDHMFDDPRLSPSVKSLIGRLQIPVLKVSMLDAGFFARKHHPARQFLDELAIAALDGHELERGMPRYDALAEIVNTLVRTYQDDVSVFASAQTALQQLLLQQENAAVEALASELDELAAVEMAELGSIIVEQMIAQRILQANPPDVITRFLSVTWSAALRQAYGAQGEAEPDFVLRLAAMDDLLWSVLPKVGPEERFKMVNMLPGMLKTLEDGAKAVGLSSAEAQAFFSELVQCHAAAIRNGIKAMSSVAPVDTNAVTDYLSHDIAPLEPKQVATDDALVFDLELDTQVDDVEEDAIRSSLPERGEWVDWLDEQGQIVRLKLSWVSPQQTRYLFTNRDVKGQAFLKAEVEVALMSGRMTRLMLEGSLTDRALQGVISELS